MLYKLSLRYVKKMYIDIHSGGRGLCRAMCVLFHKQYTMYIREHAQKYPSAFDITAEAVVGHEYD